MTSPRFAAERELHPLRAEPSDKLGYFWRATAMDARPITFMKEFQVIISALSLVET